MLPTYKTGDYVLARGILLFLKEQDVVILTHPQTGRQLIKRIKEKKQNEYFVLGDNENESSDSRHFGWVTRKNIVGKVSVYSV